MPMEGQFGVKKTLRSLIQFTSMRKVPDLIKHIQKTAY